MVDASIPVSTGFTWTAAGAWATFLAILSVIIRQVGPWRKQTSEASDRLIHQLSVRLDKVEKQLATERRLHFIEIRRLEARGAMQRSLDRHKFGNREMCLDSLLRILELSPDKAPEAAKLARQQIAEQRKGEQLESATIHNAEIAAVALAERELAEMLRHEEIDSDPD